MADELRAVTAAAPAGTWAQYPAATLGTVLGGLAGCGAAVGVAAALLELLERRNASNPPQGFSGIGVLFFGFMAFALLVALCTSAGQALGCWFALRALHIPAAAATAALTGGIAIIAFVWLGPPYLGLLWAISTPLFEAPAPVQYAYHATWAALLLGLPAPLAIRLWRRTTGR